MVEYFSKLGRAVNALFVTLWGAFRKRASQPCRRCSQPVWFAEGPLAEHGYCMRRRLDEEVERRKARLIAEDMKQLDEEGR